MGESKCWKCHQIVDELRDAIVFEQGEQIRVQVCLKCIKELGARRIALNPIFGLAAQFTLGWGNPDNPDEPDLEIELFSIAEENEAQKKLTKGAGMVERTIFFLTGDDLEILHGAANSFKKERLKEIEAEER